VHCKHSANIIASAIILHVAYEKVAWRPTIAPRFGETPDMAKKDLTKGLVKSATKGINGNKGPHKKVEYGKQETESYEHQLYSLHLQSALTVRVFKIDAAIRKPFRRWSGIPIQAQTRKT